MVKHIQHNCTSAIIFKTGDPVRAEKPGVYDTQQLHHEHNTSWTSVRMRNLRVTSLRSGENKCRRTTGVNNLNISKGGICVFGPVTERMKLWDLVTEVNCDFTLDKKPKQKSKTSNALNNWWVSKIHYMKIQEGTQR